MKIWVQVDDRQFEVEVRPSGERSVVVVDGQELDVVLHEGGPAVYTMIVQGQPIDVAAVPRPRGYSVTVRGIPFEVQVQDERQRQIASRAAGRQVAEGQVTLRAPMPGQVKRVAVAAGDEVAKGQHLVVLEAMKMENDIASPRAARVEKVLVHQGQKVEQGQELVVLE